MKFLICTICLFASGFTGLAQDKPYITESIPTPDGVVMEIGSIALMPKKRVAVTTRRGDVWICDGAYDDDLSKVKWTLFTEGLHEPFGMFWRDGWLWMTQRSDFIKIRDLNGDDRADEFVSVAAPWGIDGDYHEYSFGSAPDKNGDVWVTTCLTGSSRASAKSPYRGWAFKIDPIGKATPIATGVRSPGGVGFNQAGDTFYCDNQGLWNGSSSLKHIKPGGFMGNPTGNVYWTKSSGVPKPPQPKDGSRIEIEREKHPNLVPPAVVFPHGLIGQSPTGIIPESTKGKFGPFAGQVLVAEQTHSQVQRVFLEKVNGVYQGAVWHFLDGYGSGIVPLRLSGDGTLFVGGTNRGWAARGGQVFNFDRTRWTGNVPFEVKEMRLTQDGWDLEFTKKIDVESGSDISNYTMNAWTYIYQSKYGSPQVDKSVPQVTAATVSDDGMTVSLKVDGRVKGHVHELISDLVDESGAKLWHNKGYYTINEWIQ